MSATIGNHCPKVSLNPVAFTTATDRFCAVAPVTDAPKVSSWSAICWLVRVGVP